MTGEKFNYEELMSLFEENSQDGHHLLLILNLGYLFMQQETPEESAYVFQLTGKP